MLYLILWSCVAVQSVASLINKRFCCNDRKNWIAGTRRCNGVPDCPSSEIQDNPGGEDEEFCDVPGDRKGWCDDTAEFPDSTEMPLPMGGQASFPEWAIAIFIALIATGLVLLLAIVALTVRRRRGRLLTKTEDCEGDQQMPLAPMTSGQRD